MEIIKEIFKKIFRFFKIFKDVVFLRYESLRGSLVLILVLSFCLIIKMIYFEFYVNRIKNIKIDYSILG